MNNLSITLALLLVSTLSLAGQDLKPAFSPSNGLPSQISLANLPARSMFSYMSWDKKVTPVANGLHIMAPDDRGCLIVPLKKNLSPFSDWTPRLTLAIGPGNECTILTLNLSSAGSLAYGYNFKLDGLATGQTVMVVANNGASLQEPGSKGEAKGKPDLDISNLTQVAIGGAWMGKPTDVTISQIDFVPPDGAIFKAREAAHARQLRDAESRRKAVEAQEKARQNLLANGARHRTGGVEIKQVCAVDSDVLTVVLQAGKFVPNELKPYAPQPGDEIVDEQKDKPRHLVKDGKVVDYYQRALYRKVNNTRTRLGLLSPDNTMLSVENKTAGELLEESAVDVPAAYAIQSADDPAFAKPMAPAAVFRKGKPDGRSTPFPFLYTISLKLPSPLREGATYAIRFVAVNTDQETATYTHKPRETRSLAVHAIQTGYRPDDPFKRAYFSFWMGADKDLKNGSTSYTVNKFELLDASGKTAFSGTAELAKADGAPEQICTHEKQDYTKSAVYRLDFSAFDKPGEYRVFVPGIGLSWPFRIAADVWEAPFKAAMQGIFSQRQGVELGPPYCVFKRPRTFHPADGVVFYQLDVPIQAGERGQGPPGFVNACEDSIVKLAKEGALKPTPVVPGGYQDAGDWITASHHLSAMTCWDYTI